MNLMCPLSWFFYVQSLFRILLLKSISFGLILLFQMSLPILVNAQVFLTESFESNVGTMGNGGDCGCVTATQDFLDGQNDLFARVQDIDHTANSINDYIGELDGNGNVAEGTAHYFAAEDIDDPQVQAGNPLGCLTISTNIAGRTGLEFSAYFGGNAQNPTNYESSDNLSVAYQIDNGGFTEILDFRRNATGTNISLDTDDDDIGDNGVILGVNFQRVAAAIPGSGNTLDVRICMHSNTSGEEFAVDYIQLAEGVLPVELTTFKAETTSRGIQLNWETASETNNVGFEIQRSMNAKDWTAIGFIEGQRTTFSISEYIFLDTEAIAGDNYYRLKQMDEDGTFEYSLAIQATLLEVPLIRLYPNPTNGEVFISNLNLDEVFVTLHNTLGQVIFQKELYQESIDLGELPVGWYQLSVERKGMLHLLPILKQ